MWVSEHQLGACRTITLTPSTGDLKDGQKIDQSYITIAITNVTAHEDDAGKHPIGGPLQEILIHGERIFSVKTDYNPCKNRYTCDRRENV